MAHRLIVRRIGGLALVLLSVPVCAMAQSAGAATQGAAPAPPRCDAPEHRQLDFWVGDWDVMVQGKPAGRNRITLEEDGCLVHEHWQGKITGQSFNFYDRQTGTWHQVWVSATGNVLRLEGTYSSGALRYTGRTRQADGSEMQHRLTFFDNADGTVRQFWETSTDGGATWSVAFDGHYVRRSGP